MIRLEVRNIFVISLSCLMVLSLFTMFTEQVFAVVTKDLVHANNGDACDILMIPDVVDELGTLQSAFPADELIESGIGDNTDIMQDSCTPLPSGSITVVSITNTVMPARTFSDVWYVIDTDITISNFDGAVSPSNNRAFKIDSVGVHKPLISESFLPANGFFEPGEKWEFILNSYSGSAGTESAFGSVGVPSSDSDSTGSIIAVPKEKGDFVGGTFIEIDTTALLFAGAQMTSAWLIPIIFATIGIGIVLARKF